MTVAETELPEARVLSRSEDPLSSHEAALEVIGSGQRLAHAQAAAETLERWEGSTAWELLQKAPLSTLGISRDALSKRLSDLRGANLAHSPRMRRCKHSGRRMLVWFSGPGRNYVKPQAESPTGIKARRSLVEEFREHCKLTMHHNHDAVHLSVNEVCGILLEIL